MSYNTNNNHFNRPPPTKKFKYSNGHGRGGSYFMPKFDLDAERRRLPIYSARSSLLRKVRENMTSIVIGETGSGKTTQIPQYLYEAGMAGNGIIACTQPRRVAAISISQRVAKEMKTTVGLKVGYSVRFDDSTSFDTQIKYMTDGMLLREAILDPLMKRYSVVILDEAHERTIHTDVLFGVVKSAQRRRKKLGIAPLKIIIMSATMDVDHFSQYFNNSPVYYIEGRQHPIEIKHAVSPQSDYLDSSMVAVYQIHQEEPACHDILVFLTGQEEIETTTNFLRGACRELPSDCPKMMVQPLYASLPPTQQMKVFQKTPPGHRKVILATNVAETSLTIPGIKHVIDTGKVKAKSYKPGSGMDLLKVQWISKAQGWQRTGRAGRESSGTCWRLYTEDEYAALKEMTTPEIQRCNLANVLLQLLSMGIKNVVNFDFMDPPTQEALDSAIEQLRLLSALEKKEDPLELTSLGRQMGTFPLDPGYSKVLLKSVEFKCLEEILTIVSLLSVESIFHTPHNKKEEALEARKKFISSEGDHITMLNTYRAYKAAKENRQWCFENFVNTRSMGTVVSVRRQLRDLCNGLRLPIQSCSKDTSLIRKCLAAGLFMNSAELQVGGEYLTLDRKQKVAIHPSSCLFQRKPSYLIYNELVLTSNCYMRNVALVDPDWLYDAAPDYFKRKLSNNR